MLALLGTSMAVYSIGSDRGRTQHCATTMHSSAPRSNTIEAFLLLPLLRHVYRHPLWYPFGGAFPFPSEAIQIYQIHNRSTRDSRKSFMNTRAIMPE